MKVNRQLDGHPARTFAQCAAALLMLAAVLMTMRFAGADQPAKDAPKSKVPEIVKTVPAQGAEDVDPGLKEIRVTFDRDMEKGMSWTGSPPEFPATNKKKPAKWIDKRTCVLPVTLDPETSYRVGINAPSFQNFRSADGVPAAITAIEFKTTKAGAAKANDAKGEGSPQIVKMEPENGATDVDPTTIKLKVTFNVKMGKGASWTGSGAHFPKVPNGKKFEWSEDGLTCTLPVVLEPDHEYILGINSPSFKNFRSKEGMAVDPVVYKFKTSTAKK